jgi:Zn ribbon nucleic-acid-binding protein
MKPNANLRPCPECATGGPAEELGSYLSGPLPHVWCVACGHTVVAETLEAARERWEEER